MSLISLSAIFLMSFSSCIYANQRQYPYPDEGEDSARWVVKKVNIGASAPTEKKNKIDRRTGPAVPGFLYMGKISHKHIPSYPSVGNSPLVLT
jgi:hypothetical protein